MTELIWECKYVDGKRQSPVQVAMTDTGVAIILPPAVSANHNSHTPRYTVAAAVQARTQRPESTIRIPGIVPVFHSHGA